MSPHEVVARLNELQRDFPPGVRWTRRGGDWDLVFRVAMWGVAGGIVDAEAAQRVRLPQGDRVHAVDAGLEVGIRAPQRFGNELLLGPGAGTGEEGTEEDVHPGVDH